MRNSGKSTATPLSCDGRRATSRVLEEELEVIGQLKKKPSKNHGKTIQNHPKPSRTIQKPWYWLIWLVDLHQTWRWEWDVLTPPLWKLCRYPSLSPKDSHHEGWGDCATWRSRTSCEINTTVQVSTSPDPLQLGATPSSLNTFNLFVGREHPNPWPEHPPYSLLRCA